MVQSGVPPSAWATAWTMRAVSEVDPASITPRQSVMARGPASTAAGGQSSKRLFPMNSASMDVTRMGSSACGSLAQFWYLQAHGGDLGRARAVACRAVGDGGDPPDGRHRPG